MFAGCSADYLEFRVCADVFPLVFGLVAVDDDALFYIWFPESVVAVFGVVDDEVFLGGGFDFGFFVVYGGVVSVVCAYVDVPIYLCVVVAGDDDFSCFSEHDDAFFCGFCRVFAVSDIVLIFVIFAVCGECAQLQYFSGC